MEGFEERLKEEFLRVLNEFEGVKERLEIHCDLSEIGDDLSRKVISQERADRLVRDLKEFYEKTLELQVTGALVLQLYGLVKKYLPDSDIAKREDLENYVRGNREMLEEHKTALIERCLARGQEPI